MKTPSRWLTDGIRGAEAPARFRASRVAIGFLVALVVSPAWGADRFVAQFPMRGGFVCVVAEGDREPRSIGTFSVRVYRNLEVGDYAVGIIARRDGFVRKAYALPSAEDGREEIAVEVETAGSGRYAKLHVFRFDPSTRTLRTIGQR
jgi:Periplasmic lysozyme inhibitor of I-type lysozyme